MKKFKLVWPPAWIVFNKIELFSNCIFMKKKKTIAYYNFLALKAFDQAMHMVHQNNTNNGRIEEIWRSSSRDSPSVAIEWSIL